MSRKKTEDREAAPGGVPGKEEGDPTLGAIAGALMFAEPPAPSAGPPPEPELDLEAALKRLLRKE